MKEKRYPNGSVMRWGFTAREGAAAYAADPGMTGPPLPARAILARAKSVTVSPMAPAVPPTDPRQEG